MTIINASELDRYLVLKPGDSLLVRAGSWYFDINACQFGQAEVLQYKQPYTGAPMSTKQYDTLRQAIDYVTSVHAEKGGVHES